MTQITISEIKWMFGISKADRYYYTEKGKEQLEIMYSQHCAEKKRLDEGRARLEAFWAARGEVI